MELAEFGDYQTPNGVTFTFGAPGGLLYDSNSCNCFLDVTLTDSTGKRMANFATPKALDWVMSKNARTGENLHGLYFCFPDNMVIVREMTQEIVGQVIDALIEWKELECYFQLPRSASAED